MTASNDLQHQLEFTRDTLNIRRAVMLAAARGDAGALAASQAEYHARLNVLKKPVRRATPSFFAVQRDVEATIHLPEVFVLAEHRHDKYGRVFVAIFGRPDGTEQARHTYEELWASFPDEGPEVVADYLVCHECRTLEQGTPSNCSACGGDGWKRRFGKRLAPFGAPVRALGVRRPNGVGNQAHYDALIAGEARERT